MKTESAGMSAAERRKVDRMVAEMLNGLGATVNPSWSDEFIVETVFGKLHVGSHGDWIHCRFEDVKRAVDGVLSPDWAGQREPNGIGILFRGASLNRFSGKWNHHYFGRFSAEEAFTDFEWCLSTLLPEKAGQPQGGSKR